MKLFKRYFLFIYTNPSGIHTAFGGRASRSRRVTKL